MAVAQIKISVNPELAASFKSACAASGVSMASALSKFMADFSNAGHKANVHCLAARRQRRAAVKRLISHLELIKAAEGRYMENIPPNLQESSVYERAEETVSLIEEAAELLASAY